MFNAYKANLPPWSPTPLQSGILHQNPKSGKTLDPEAGTSIPGTHCLAPGTLILCRPNLLSS